MSCGSRARSARTYSRPRGRRRLRKSATFPSLGETRRDANRPSASRAFSEVLVGQRKDLAFLEVREDVVVRRQRVVVRRRERLIIGLDQTLVLVQRVECVADLRAFG